jgi:hypothetical protein
MIPFPEQYKVVKLYQGAANAVACDVVSTKNCHKLWFVVSHVGAADTDLVLSLYEATDVAAGTNAAVTKTCPIWVNTDNSTTSDTLAATTAAYSYTIDTGVAPNQLVVIEVDPAKLSAGYDCVYLADSGGNASNTCTILAIMDQRYQGASLPAAITD